MTGPYERVQTSTDWLMLHGTVDLDTGSHRVHAELLRGEATLEYIEQYDAYIRQFGSDQPIRRLGARSRVRLVVEADLGDMVFRFDPKTPPS